MKKITNITKLITGIVIMLIVSLVYGLELNYKDSLIKQVKAELLQKETELIEAKKPSKVELQKAELIRLEEQWKKTEEAIYKLQAYKPRIETKIQNLRKEIINTTPKAEKVEEVKK